MLLWSPTLGQADSSGERINQFTVDYCTAVDAYIAGDWPKAADMLRACMATEMHDQAPATLLEYMQSGSTGKAPADWDGCRALTMK